MAKDWNPASWRSKAIEQVPAYPDANALAETEKRLASFPPLVFAGEARKLKKALGEDVARRIPISSIKSMIGHSGGGAGGVEGVMSVLTIRDNVLAPTINYEFPDPDCDLDYVPNEARKHEVDVVLSNSFGLGGQNATLVLRRYAPR